MQTHHDHGEHVRFSIRDAGAGIDPQSLGKLFDAFYTTKTHGMGVGLFISRSIIESHEGRLWASANDGPGATFCFSIPCAPGLVVGSNSQSQATSAKRIASSNALSWSRAKALEFKRSAQGLSHERADKL